MSFLSDFFNNIKNKLTNKKTLPEPQSIRINTFDSVDQMEVDAIEGPKSIYENPTPFAIHSNVTSKQSSELIYLLDMAYVAATADNSFYLPHPYKIHHSGKSAQKYEEQFIADTKFSDEYLKRTVKLSKKLDVHSKSRLDLYDSIRTIYPDFCINMQKKISPEDYAFYRQNKTSLKKCLSSRNTYSDEIPLQEQLLEYQDNLAKLVDSLDFSKACKIEDSFVVAELNTFLEKFASLPLEEQSEFAKKKITIKQFDGKKNKISVLTFAHQLKEEREARIEKYHSIEELYTKLNNQPNLKLTIAPLKDANVENINPKDLKTEDDAR